MRISDIRNKAKALGITPNNMGKAELIHAIQMAEHNAPCYGTSEDNCTYTDCCFRDDCLTPKPAKKADAQNSNKYLHECRNLMQRINGR